MQTPQVMLTMNANEIETGCSVPLGELRGLLEAEIGGACGGGLILSSASRR